MLITDVCVPLSALSQVMAETEADIAAAGFPGPVVAHAMDGAFARCVAGVVLDSSGSTLLSISESTFSPSSPPFQNPIFFFEQPTSTASSSLTRATRPRWRRWVRSTGG